MPEQAFQYVIVGAGLAGVSAAEGIRERDAKGSILLLGSDPDLPYDRPPLSKQLWTGAKRVEEVFLHDEAFYRDKAIELRRNVEVARIDATAHTLSDRQGNAYRYGKLLLATGGTPKRLSISGGDLPGICYYRTLRDYHTLRGAAMKGTSALVIGGGFIGSELAAALCMNSVKVTMIFPSATIGSRVFPESLAKFLTEYYRGKGIEVLSSDTPTLIARDGSRFATQTRAARTVRTDLVVAGVGITPNIALAQVAGLKTDDGVIVNEYLQSSNPDIYAAGDIAYFPEAGLGPRRIEHWDNALNQGKHAGRNMGGANERFTYVPFFFSDLFEFGYEAVGVVDSRLRTFADWQEENKTGVIYYLDDRSRVRGAMMCGIFGKVDDARALIAKAQPVAPESLRGAIRP